MRAERLRLPIPSKVAIAVLLLAAVLMSVAVALESMSVHPGIGFAVFPALAALALWSAHRESTRSKKIRMWESVIATITGIAFTSLGIYALLGYT